MNSPPSKSRRFSIPEAAVQRKASPFDREAPEWLLPTTTSPLPETAVAELKNVVVVKEPNPSIPSALVQRKPSAPERELLCPTTTSPFAETPAAELTGAPPGSSPKPSNANSADPVITAAREQATMDWLIVMEPYLTNQLPPQQADNKCPGRRIWAKDHRSGVCPATPRSGFWQNHGRSRADLT